MTDAFLDGLTSLFVTVLNMSLRAAWVLLAVFLVHLVFRRAPRGALATLWGVAGFRLLCPVSFAAVFSLLPSAQVVPRDIDRMATPAINSGISAVDALVNPLLPSPELGYSANPLQVLLPLAAAAWALGVLTALAASAVSLARLLLHLRGATPLKVLPDAALPGPRRAPKVYCCEGLPTAFVLGGRIYLPAGLFGEETRYILAHEYTHLRRGDPFIKPLAWLVCCLHWFNPLVWAAFALLGRDIERACDEAVLRALGPAAKKGYCAALLAMAETAGRRHFRPATLAFGEGNVKARIKNALRYKKAAVGLTAVAVVAAVALAVCLLADPAKKAPDSEPAAIQGPGESEQTTPADSGEAAEISLSVKELSAVWEQEMGSLTPPAYTGAPFALSLPAGWRQQPEAVSSDPLQPRAVTDLLNRPVGYITLGTFEDMPDVPAEEFYKVAFSDIRLGSLVSWCNDYTPVRSADGQESALGVVYVSDFLLHPDDYSAAAEAETLEYPCVTVYDRALGVYAAMVLYDADTDAQQLQALAEGMALVRSE